MAWLRFIWPLSRANPVPPGQSNSLNAELGFPPDLLVSLDRASGQDCASSSRASCVARFAPAASRSGPRFRPRASWPASSASHAASSSTRTGSSPPRATSRRGRGPAPASARPTRRTSSGDGGPRRRPDPGPRLLGGLPDPASFPRAQWQRHYRAAIGALSTSSLPYPDPRGERTLRNALAAYLGRVARRGHDARARPGLRRVHAGPGARLPRAASPGRAAPGRRGSLLQLPPRADRERRARDRAGRRRRQRHRRPRSRPRTTSRASSSRRRTPIRPARCWRRNVASSSRSGRARTDALIIEDDYDAEFRYDRAPIGALQGLRPIASCTAGASARR